MQKKIRLIEKVLISGKKKFIVKAKYRNGTECYEFEDLNHARNETILEEVDINEYVQIL